MSSIAPPTLETPTLLDLQTCNLPGVGLQTCTSGLQVMVKSALTISNPLAIIGHITTEGTNVSMDIGKTTVLSNVVKFGNDKPFKSATIWAMCDLSRSLVRYHLDQFVHRDWLVKNGMYYSVVNQEVLLDEIVNENRIEIKTRNLRPTKILIKERTEMLNKIFDLIVCARLMELPLNQEIQSYMVGEIDETINDLRNAKKYIKMKDFSERRRYDTLRGEEATLYEAFSKIIDPLMPKAKFIEAIKEKVSDY